jgi:hypothetical protein
MALQAQPVSTAWRVGQRVSRNDSQELGTIVEADGEIKVKWDDGRTSYYSRANRPMFIWKRPLAGHLR